MQKDSAVAEALQAVVQRGMSDLAREHAKAALLVLIDNELQTRSEGQLHVMLSCELIGALNYRPPTTVGGNSCLSRKHE